MTVQLIANGEASGRLESMLERAALALEREQSRFTDAFVRILEPLLILLMGAMVMVIVLAILMPVFSLNQMIG
jgi:general secretion pathway protein F